MSLIIEKEKTEYCDVFKNSNHNRDAVREPSLTKKISFVIKNVAPIFTALLYLSFVLISGIVETNVVYKEFNINAIRKI